MYRYFIAYVWSVGPSHGFGNLVVDSPKQIKTASYIEELTRRIETDRGLPEGARVAVTNIVSLDWPS